MPNILSQTINTSQLKKIFTILSVLALLTSCAKKSNDITNQKPGLSKDISLAVAGQNENKPPLITPSDSYNYLGFGYDVTDKFNDEASVRANVINTSAYAASGSQRINIGTSTEGAARTIEANDAAELSARFSSAFVETNGSVLFGNTLNGLFPGTNITDKKYVYGYYSDYWIYKSYNIFYDQNVNNFLTDNFKRDILSLTAQELVSKYGTHVLTRIDLGRRFDIFYQAEALTKDKRSIIKEGLQYALKSVFGLSSVENLINKSSNLESLNANGSAKVYYKSYGGDISKLKTQTVDKRTMLNITDWLHSANVINASFIGPLENGLVSLDKFIDDSTKKAEVNLYIKQYIASKTVTLSN
ncbi:MAG: hypothetical protein BGO48_16870 [Mucilaginibacter sp. 44-25]|nr:MAG: hypothetical protein BGO48_16870 [Mucilaginibacter sp. 44-25]